MVMHKQIYPKKVRKILKKSYFERQFEIAEILKIRKKKERKSLTNTRLAILQGKMAAGLQGTVKQCNPVVIIV